MFTVRLYQEEDAQHAGIVSMKAFLLVLWIKAAA